MRAVLVCGLAALQFFSAPLLAFAQESPTIPEPAPTPSTAPTPEKLEEEKVAPPPPTVPAEVLHLEAPSPTTPPPSPMLDAPIMQDLALIPAGQLQFELFVQEEYDDNVNLVAQGRESDFITRISPTVAVNRTTGTTSLNLRYVPTFRLYARFPDLNRTDHTLVFDGSWQAIPRLRFSLQNRLLITQNAVEEISSLGISRAGLNQTTQNTVSPALDLKLTSRSNLALRYTNRIIDQEEGEDRTVNGGTITFGHSHARGGVNLAYNIAYVDRERTSNSLSHLGTVSTSWRLNPKDVLNFSTAF